MKLRRFNVFYSVTTSFDADVFAKNKKEAIAKVVEVIGQPVRIEGVNELPVEVLTDEANTTTTTSSAKGMVYFYNALKKSDRRFLAAASRLRRSKTRRRKKR